MKFTHSHQVDVTAISGEYSSYIDDNESRQETRQHDGQDLRVKKVQWQREDHRGAGYATDLRNDLY